MSLKGWRRIQQAQTLMTHDCFCLPLIMVTNCVARQVQKAQTKRWLKQEYRVALAAALEQRIEDVCETKVAASDGVGLRLMASDCV